MDSYVHSQKQQISFDVYQNDPYRSRRSPVQRDRGCSRGQSCITPDDCCECHSVCTSIPSTSDGHPSICCSCQCPESGRANSYLPYSNHAPDISLARSELYLEEDEVPTHRSKLRPISAITIEEKQLSSSRRVWPGLVRPMPLTAASLAELGQRKHQQRRQRCLGGRICVFIAFLAILLGGIAAFICWPRTPLVWMSGGAEAVNDPADWGPDTHPWLHATWQVNITLDNRQNWIPTHLTKLEFDIADSLTLRKFAWSKAGPLTLAPQTITPLRLVFDVNYDTSTLTDTTFQNLYHACGPQKMGTPPALNVVLHRLSMRALVLAGPFRRYLHLHRSWHHPTMNTQVLPVNPSHFKLENTTCTEFSSRNAKSIITDADDQAAINKAVQCLKEGEAVGIPTETVYGLAANALEANAVAKIFAAKNRPQDNPLIVHVSSIDMLKSILPNHTIPSVYLPVINQCWPGPLTLILPKSSIIPSSVTCNQPTVAVRFPSHPVARALIDACGFPLAAPSANSSGKPSPTLASHVLDDLHGRIPMILDGGACDVGVESTVLDGLRSPPAILRPGGVTYETLRALPGMEQLQVYRKHFVDKALELAPTTPGMKYRHYSPEAMVILVEQNNEATSHLQFQAVWRKELAALQESGVGVTRVGILRTTSDEETVRWEETKTEDSVECISLQMGRCSHPEEVARSMFKGLRELDSRSVDFIFVEGIAETQEGMAVMNRLRKAASKVIEL